MATLINAGTALKRFRGMSSLAKESFNKATLIKDFLENFDRFIRPFTKEVTDFWNDRMYFACKTYLEKEGKLLWRKKDYGVYKSSFRQKELVRYEYWLIDYSLVKFYHSGPATDVKLVFPIWVNVEKFLDKVRGYINRIEWSVKDIKIENKAYYLSEVHRRIIREIHFWLNNRDWFYNKEIPYKRTYLLCGSPGTGKSQFVKHISESTMNDITTIDVVAWFPSYKKDLRKYQEADDGLNGFNLPVTGDIFLIEDIDRVDFSRVRLDAFLNFLDGIGSIEGKLTFITCNDESKLPDALKRPGRVDRIVYFEKFDREGLLYIAKNIFDESRAEEIVDMYTTTEFKNEVDIKNLNSPAHFTKFCTDISIKEFEDKLDKV